MTATSNNHQIAAAHRLQPSKLGAGDLMPI